MGKQHDECRKWLDSYKEMRVEILRLQQKHRSLWDQATRVTPRLSPVPGGGSGDRDLLLTALSDADDEVIGKYIEAIARQKEIEDFIDELPTDMSRIILKLRYVDLRDWLGVWNTLAKSGIDYSLDHIYRMHGIALREARELWVRKGNTLNG